MEICLHLFNSGEYHFILLELRSCGIDFRRCFEETCTEITHDSILPLCLTLSSIEVNFLN